MPVWLKMCDEGKFVQGGHIRMQSSVSRKLFNVDTLIPIFLNRTNSSTCFFQRDGLVEVILEFNEANKNIV